MKNYVNIICRITLIAILLSFNIIDAFTQKKILITDFGCKPDDRRNVVDPIKNALKACAAQDSSVLVFPKGRYDFWPDFTSQQTSIGIEMNKLKNVTIDGEGSEFIFHGKMQIANLVGCEKITLRNFTVDWDHPFIAQGQYVQTTDDYIDVKFDPEVYVIENNLFFLIGEGWKSRPIGYFTLYDQDKKEILYKTHDGDNKASYLGKAEEINVENNTVKVGENILSFDYLVLAGVAETNFYNIPGAQENSLTLKSIEDAIKIKNKIIIQIKTIGRRSLRERR